MLRKTESCLLIVQDLQLKLPGCVSPMMIILRVFISLMRTLYDLWVEDYALLSLHLDWFLFGKDLLSTLFLRHSVVSLLLNMLALEVFFICKLIFKLQLMKIFHLDICNRLLVMTISFFFNLFKGRKDSKNSDCSLVFIVKDVDMLSEIGRVDV